MNFFIVAVDEKWGFAKNNKIPWYYKEDFQFFKEKTKDTTCIMGYNTFSEMKELRKYPQKNQILLPNRKCIIMTKNHINEGKLYHSDILFTDNLNMENKNNINNDINYAFIGGKSIYDYALNKNSDYGYITRIKKDYHCNSFFNNTLLFDNFYCHSVLKETDELRFEFWKRKLYI